MQVHLAIGILEEESMLDEQILSEAQARFGITGPAISETEVESVFSKSFPGKKDVVQFYLRNNGGSRTRRGGTVYCGVPEHQVSRDHLEKIRVEGFYAIHKNPEEKVIGFLSMLKHRALMSRKCGRYPQLKSFVDLHMPLAFDHCGNEFWINVENGHIGYLLLDSMLEGPIDVASSFQDFLSRFWINEPASDSD
jgi:hypothetical protein